MTEKEKIAKRVGQLLRCDDCGTEIRAIPQIDIAHLAIEEGWSIRARITGLASLIDPDKLLCGACGRNA